MKTPLDEALSGLGLSNEAFGEECKPPIHRTLIWCYRRGKKVPGADKALSILAALGMHGVQMGLDGLVSHRARARSRKTAA